MHFFLFFALSIVVVTNFLAVRFWLTHSILGKKYSWMLFWLVSGCEAVYFSTLRFDILPQWLSQWLAASQGVTLAWLCSLLLFLPFMRLTNANRFADALLGATIVYLTVSVYIAHEPPVIASYSIEIPSLQKSMRACVVADVHLGQGRGVEYAHLLVGQINALAPDIVLIAGDLADGNLAKLKPILEPLSGIKAPAEIYVSLGNHEYYRDDTQQLIEYLKTLGMHTLINENIKLENGLVLVGVADLAGERTGKLLPDYKKAFESVESGAVVMSHQPRQSEELLRYHPSLIISGHTHGGQIFPFGLLVRFVQPYLHGLYKIQDGTQIFVTQGVGWWGPPMRIGTHAEIGLLTLQPAK